MDKRLSLASRLRRIGDDVSTTTNKPVDVDYLRSVLYEAARSLERYKQLRATYKRLTGKVFYD